VRRGDPQRRPREQVLASAGGRELVLPASLAPAVSEYDPILPARRSTRDREQVEALFRAAATPYLRSPWGWFAWAAALPAAALATAPLARSKGPAGVLLLWSITILVAGVVEAVPHFRQRGQAGSALATWAMRGQANLSLVGVCLSGVLLWQDQAWLLPGLWLLLLGHSLYLLGGLAFPPLRTCGLGMQLGGALALWPRIDPLLAFAVTTALTNAFVGWSILRARRDDAEN